MIVSGVDGILPCLECGWDIGRETGADFNEGQTGGGRSPA